MANRLGCWTPQLTPIVDAIAIFCFHSLVQCLWVCGRFVRSRLLNAASTLIPIHPEQISQSSLSEIMVSFCQEIVALLTLHFVMSVIRLPAPRPFPLSRYMVGSCFLILDLVEASTSLRSHFTFRQTVQCQVLFQLELPCNQRGVPEGALPRESSLSKGTFCDGTQASDLPKWDQNCHPRRKAKKAARLVKLLYTASSNVSGS